MNYSDSGSRGRFSKVRKISFKIYHLWVVSAFAAIRSNESASKAHEAASGANEEVTILYWAVSGYMAVLVAVSEYAKYVRGFQMIMNEETKSKF